MNSILAKIHPDNLSVETHRTIRRWKQYFEGACFGILGVAVVIAMAGGIAYFIKMVTR